MSIIQDIKTLLELRKIFMEVKQMKPAWKSTEFYLTVLGIIASLAGALVGYLPPELVLKIVAGLTAVYTIARTVAKMTATPVDDAIIDKIGEIIKKLGGQLPADK